MKIIPDYREHRIEIYPVATGDRWNAGVRIRRAPTDEKPYVTTVTCAMMSAALGEFAAALFARRWVDLRLDEQA